MQECAMKIKKIKMKMKKRTTFHDICTQNVKFDKQLQKPTGTDQNETSSIQASYNKDTHTVLITWLGIL